jgi:hypothetical protein
MQQLYRQRLAGTFFLMKEMLYNAHQLGIVAACWHPSSSMWNTSVQLQTQACHQQIRWTIFEQLPWEFSRMTRTEQ